MSYALLLASLLVAAHPQRSSEAPDARTHYDVEAYDLRWAVLPDQKRLEGLVTVEAAVTTERMQAVELDLKQRMQVGSVRLVDGPELAFRHAEERLVAELPAPLERGARFAVQVRYGGHPIAENDFDGFHWARSKDGRPWIGTSCQTTGAHAWYPCKASYYHPSDKPERIRVELCVPKDLYGVSNGRLVEIVEGAPEWLEPPAGEWRTFRWEHFYPLMTYAVTLNVAAYDVVESELRLPGLAEPVPFVYYVLPEDREKADLQFQEVPRLFEVFSEAFGPFPFPESKVGLVQTSFWGMEHSSAIAYGSSFPAWRKAKGEKDPHERSNRLFDYILVHEVAHEWWGNAVSARDWGHFWLHEGFGTYAEGVYVERTQGREAADRYFDSAARALRRSKGSLYRGANPSSGQAYSGLIYSKGACVLNTLRHYLDDDELWWKSLRDFNLEHRYRTSVTEDFQAILERNSGRSFAQFFQDWFYGSGTPALQGELRATKRSIAIAIDNTTGSFHVPLDLAWSEKGVRKRERIWLAPGRHEREIECASKPEALEVVHLSRVLGSHRVEVVP